MKGKHDCIKCEYGPVVMGRPTKRGWLCQACSTEFAIFLEEKRVEAEAAAMEEFLARHAIRKVEAEYE